MITPSQPGAQDRHGLRRLQVALLACVALPALAFLTGCSDKILPEKEVIQPVKAMQVADATLLADRWFSGRAKATQEVNLSFRVAGPLITRPLKVGDTVAEGDIVARIDPRDLELNLRSIKGQPAKAKAVLKGAEAYYQRSKRILKQDPGAISENAMDRALENRDRAAANVDSLVVSAEDQLAYTNLNSPFDGTVVATYGENFEDFRAKQPAVRVLETSCVELVVNIPQNLISLAPAVMDIVVTFDALPNQPVLATVKQTAPKGTV